MQMHRFQVAIRRLPGGAGANAWKGLGFIQLSEAP